MGCFAVWLLFLQQCQFLPVRFQSAVVPLWGHGCVCARGRPRAPWWSIPKAQGKNSVPRSGGGHGGRREQCKSGGERRVTQGESRRARLSALTASSPKLDSLLPPAFPGTGLCFSQSCPEAGRALALSPSCSGHPAPLRLPLRSVHPSACPDGRFYAPLRPEAPSRAAPTSSGVSHPHPLPRCPRQLLTAFPALSRGICFILRLTGSPASRPSRPVPSRRGTSRWRDISLPPSLPPFLSPSLPAASSRASDGESVTVS